jgi:hypothetical protein
VGGLGFENPAGALGLVAVAVLVALWLLERRRRVIPVASLFLWRQLPARQMERLRFRPDLLFLLQLALLLALVAGLVRPSVEGVPGAVAGARLVLVLDVSASMQTHEAAGTRFELARRHAHALVAGLGSTDETMLITASERARVAVRWTLDHALVQDRLEGLTALDTPTDVTPALELALGEARARAGTRVAVLTDLPPEAAGVSTDALDWEQIGETDDNAAVASLDVDAPAFRPVSEATVSVVVRNYGHAARHVTLEARVGDTPWTVQQLTLAPREAEPVLLTDPPAPGVVSVRLRDGDALPADDEAFGWLPPPVPLDVLLVTDSRPFVDAFRAVAAAIGGSRVDAVSPEHYEAVLPVAHRVVLFDGVAPPPSTNALYAAPPPGNTVCPAGEATDDVRVVDWAPSHPALAGLDALDATVMPQARPLESPGWGTPIVLAAAHGTAFPLLVAGERDGRRVACLGARLGAPLASSDGLPLLVLALGVVRWLEEPADVALRVETGAPVVAPAALAPAADGDLPPGLRLAGEPPVLLAERTGVFHLRTAGDREGLVLANLFDDRESDVGRAANGSHPATARAAVAAPSGARRELSWWLYLVVAVLLALEWATWARGRTA